MHRLGADEGPIECRCDGQRVVDEGAVEAVESTVKLHVEAQCVVDEAQDGVIIGCLRPLPKLGQVVGRHLGALRYVQAERQRARCTFDGRPAGEHDRHCLRIAGDVPLRGGGGIAR